MPELFNKIKGDKITQNLKISRQLNNESLEAMTKLGEVLKRIHGRLIANGYIMSDN